MEPHFWIITLIMIKLSQANILQDCKTESGVTQENIISLRNGERVNDANLKQYSGCVLTKFGLMNGDGTLQNDKIKPILSLQYSEEETDKVIQQCAVKRDTPQETAYEAILCGYIFKKKTNTV